MAISIKILQTGSIRIRLSHRHQPADKAVLLRRYVGKDEGIGSRLEQENLAPGDLKAVVLSHLHHDHGDGLPDLVGAPVWITEEHWQAYKMPFHATMEGAVPNQWPETFKPSILQPTGGPIGPWNQSYSITEDGKVVALDTLGHVPGHLSVIVRADDVSYLLLGDTTYDQDLLDQELTDGVNSNRRWQSILSGKSKSSQGAKTLCCSLLTNRKQLTAWRRRSCTDLVWSRAH
ncbi:metallo-beta-lactamase superfamily protein [Colletotrichum salicis]|uniref:Metallo-beta-lactamase superfamily protein n=1 Tax=Colletotrichum salicis TaxID=1209931 RepID=A0A135RWD7_9PEZI|nr:metallo-beta-lactamase superfamily protein [Colletotrichum salicis]